jgi:hypothetical protein
VSATGPKPAFDIIQALGMGLMQPFYSGRLARTCDMAITFAL